MNRHIWSGIWSGPGVPPRRPVRPPEEEDTTGDADLRDYFAGQAMMGFVATGEDFEYTTLAVKAYIAADAMLAERKGRGK